MMHTWAIRPVISEGTLRRFEYVLEKFGITMRERGATWHGLRHEVLKEVCQLIAGEASPAQGADCWCCDSEVRSSPCQSAARPALPTAEGGKELGDALQPGLLVVKIPAWREELASTLRARPGSPRRLPLQRLGGKR